MAGRGFLVSTFGALAALALTVGCADIRLEFPEEEVEVKEFDNLLVVNGDYCTSPAADVAYPVKIMFLVDGSGSQQFADQNRQRVVAVEETINALIGQPNVYFKIIVFNATVSATPSTDDEDKVFSNDMVELVSALTNLAEADTLTDYQGALAVGYNELLRDMTSVSQDENRGYAELGRTKYVVILISDGLPDPQCLAGQCNDIVEVGFPPDPNCGGQLTNRICESNDFLMCLLKEDDGVDPDVSCSGGVCNYNGVRCFEQADADTLFGGVDNTQLAAGNDYNQPYQILQNVFDMMELADRFEVGELRVHSGLVLDPLADPAIIAIFGDPAQAIPLMQEVASIGEGQYMEFYGGDSINFLSINFASVKQNRVIRGFYANNTSARIVANELKPDTDSDGLTDDEEFKLGSNALNPDSDGDGYSDYLEWQLRGFAFDFDDPCLPPINDTGAYTPDCDPNNPGNCRRQGNGFRDHDGDGMHDCAERAIGTDPERPDSDADGIIDPLDFVLGLDPIRWDYDDDSDQDGVPNGTEVEWHLDPLAEQTQKEARKRYRYDRELTGTTVDGRTCYDFVVRKIRLAGTGEPLAFENDGVGYNKVLFYLSENMSDALDAPPLYRVACVLPRWVPPSVKFPESGEVTLIEDDFHYLFSNDPIFTDPAIAGNTFVEDQHCLRTCNKNSDCACRDGCIGSICRETDWQCCDDDGCGNQQSCISGACRASCLVDSDCGDPANNICHMSYCWRRCATDSDCPNQQVCGSGRCWNAPIQ